jgi:hypothetical protein
MSVTSESMAQLRKSLIPRPPRRCSEKNLNSVSRRRTASPTFGTVPTDLSLLLDDPVLARWATEIGDRYRISEIQALRTLAQALLIEHKSRGSFV